VTSSDPRFGQSTDSLIEGGVFFPNAGYCNDPRLATNNLQQAAEAAGAVFFFGCRVTNIRSVDNKVIGITLSDGKDIDAPVIVNAAGPHSSKINQLAGITGNCSISTRALRHESVHLTLPENYGGEKNGIVTFDHNVGSYTRPDLGETIFVGSQGTDFESPSTVDPDDFDRNFSENAMEPVYRLAQRIPTLGIPNRLKGIVDLWDVTEDWIPVYDRSDLSGFYLAIGTSGNQFKTAPVVGVLMAELIAACENGRDHDVNPIGVYLKHTGHHIDLGVFSRNREINYSSSFSVLA
jgi:sarcosine oxidase subunit beta